MSEDYIYYHTCSQHDTAANTQDLNTDRTVIEQHKPEGAPTRTAKSQHARPSTRHYLTNPNKDRPGSNTNRKISTRATMHLNTTRKITTRKIQYLYKHSHLHIHIHIPTIIFIFLLLYTYIHTLLHSLRAPAHASIHYCISTWHHSTQSLSTRHADFQHATRELPTQHVFNQHEHVHNTNRTNTTRSMSDIYIYIYIYMCIYKASI